MNAAGLLVLGVILIVLGVIIPLHILWIIGVILAVVGVALLVLDALGASVGSFGRRRGPRV